jgi:hypothetical protein
MNRNWGRGNAGGGGAVYGLGLIGSAVYYMQHVTNFWDVVFGLFKAILWPAFLIYQALGALKM